MGSDSTGGAGSAEGSRKSVTLALTGASGAVYGLTLARMLLETGAELHLIFSEASVQVVETETGMSPELWRKELLPLGSLYCWDLNDFNSPVASGSARSDGMIIAPCSMGALGRIAAGVSSNLIERAADVCLKERRRLVLLCRETPLSVIHLENMLRVSRAGGIIMPPVPAFYTRPAGIGDIVEHSCSRVLDLFGCAHEGARRWGSMENMESND